MNTMFILRGSSYRGPHRDALGNLAQTGKPDGMMIRPDNYFTENKSAAKLFNSEAEAIDYYKTVLLPTWTDVISKGHMIFAVEVEVKPTVHKITKTSTLIS